MLKTYSKQEAPAWERRLTLILGFLFGATVLLFTVWAITLFIDNAAVDDCLDKGGSYDYERGQCDYEASHGSPQ